MYGVLHTGTRYVEYDIVTHGNRRQMIGVAEAKKFRSGPYPGNARVKGISLYGENGHIYRNGGSEGWSGSLHHGDRGGVLVDISEDKRDAKIAWFLNGNRVKRTLNLKDYMNVNDGIVFTVTMHDNAEEIQIVLDPAIPDF